MRATAPVPKNHGLPSQMQDQADTPSVLSFVFDKTTCLCNAQLVWNLGQQPLLRLILSLPGYFAWAGLHLATMGKPKLIPSLPNKNKFHP